MNVFYKGIANPVSISVPGVPSERISASITGGNRLKKIASGQYIAEMSPSSPNQVFVNVTATMVDGTERNMGRMEFRAKRLPKPFSAINGKDGSIRMSPNEFQAQLGLSAKYDDEFAFNLTCVVSKFWVYATDAQNQIVVNEWNVGSRITPDIKQKLSRAKKGYRVTFDQIKAKGNDGVEHTLSPIVITIS